MLLQFKGISGSDMTVLDLVERYISLKTGVKKSTQQGYQTVISNLKKEPFALRRIDSIKISDAKLFLNPFATRKRDELQFDSQHQKCT